jgi:hypothetical protein
MGSIIYDDISEYEALCRKYNEAVQYSRGSADCYGPHGAALKKRRDEAWLAEQRMNDGRKAVEAQQREQAGEDL